MPAVKKGESKSDYMKRCIPEVMGEGAAQDHAVAKCSGMFDEGYGMSFGSWEIEGVVIALGGPGSGNFGHSGRAGLVGGSGTSYVTGGGRSQAMVESEKEYSRRPSRMEWQREVHDLNEGQQAQAEQEKYGETAKLTESQKTLLNTPIGKLTSEQFQQALDLKKAHPSYVPSPERLVPPESSHIPHTWDELRSEDQQRAEDQWVENAQMDGIYSEAPRQEWYEGMARDWWRGDTGSSDNGQDKGREIFVNWATEHGITKESAEDAIDSGSIDEWGIKPDESKLKFRSDLPFYDPKQAMLPMETPLTNKGIVRQMNLEGKLPTLKSEQQAKYEAWHGLMGPKGEVKIPHDQMHRMNEQLKDAHAEFMEHIGDNGEPSWVYRAADQNARSAFRNLPDSQKLMHAVDAASGEPLTARTVPGRQVIHGIPPPRRQVPSTESYDFAGQDPGEAQGHIVAKLKGMDLMRENVGQLHTTGGIWRGAQRGVLLPDKTIADAQFGTHDDTAFAVADKNMEDLKREGGMRFYGDNYSASLDFMADKHSPSDIVALIADEKLPKAEKYYIDANRPSSGSDNHFNAPATYDQLAQAKTWKHLKYLTGKGAEFSDSIQIDGITLYLENLNHDERGRFASGPGGGEGGVFKDSVDQLQEDDAWGKVRYAGVYLPDGDKILEASENVGGHMGAVYRHREQLGNKNLDELLTGGAVRFSNVASLHSGLELNIDKYQPRDIASLIDRKKLPKTAIYQIDAITRAKVDPYDIDAQMNIPAFHGEATYDQLAQAKSWKHLGYLKGKAIAASMGIDLDELLEELELGNPYHDESGKFATGPGGGAATEKKLAFKIPTNIKGEGTKEKPYKCGDDIRTAAQLLTRGYHVELNQPEEVATLTHRLSAIVRKAQREGKAPPNIELCNISVPNTNLFCQDNLGIPRINMPQFKGTPVKGSKAEKMKVNDRGEVDTSADFVKTLRDQGIAVKEKTISASHLRASQSQLNGVQVGGMVHAVETGKLDLTKKPIFVTRDNYVVDGHHTWAALTVSGMLHKKDVNVPVYELDMDIGSALWAANEYTGAMGIAAKSVPKK